VSDEETTMPSPSSSLKIVIRSHHFSLFLLLTGYTRNLVFDGRKMERDVKYQSFKSYANLFQERLFDLIM
jgi:hypothetical protein